MRLGELTNCVGGFETANMHETAPADPVLVAQVAESVIHYSGIRKGHSYPRGIGRERARSERRRSKDVHVDGASLPPHLVSIHTSLVLDVKIRAPRLMLSEAQHC